MNDLRHDPDELPTRGYSVVDEWVLRHDHDASKPKPAQAFANIRAQFGAQFDAMDPDAHAIDARNLRTVAMPNLRSPDCRTADDKLRAELVRLVDALQALTLRVDVLIEDQARTITELTAYIRDHSEAD